ncbi:MAG: formyl transferase [Candidatus Magasanikbacteria bacterium]|nr:formyl transferase [Candidatus Magasanikbacteria bacterium]
MSLNKAGIKNVILLCRKISALECVQFLFKNKIAIVAIVTHPDDPAKQTLQAIARAKKILFFTDDAPLYRMIERRDKRLQNIDLVISYLFWKKVRLPLIGISTKGCINFHPAPLPDYKSRAGYNTAILDQRKNFGVSAHFVEDETFDSGQIIKVLTFPIDPKTETVISLEQKTQRKLVELFKSVITSFLLNKKFKLAANKGGLYLTAGQLDELKRIDPSKESLEEIHRKIRAFFFPPYPGAYVEIKGEKFTLLDEATLKYIAELLTVKS